MTEKKYIDAEAWLKQCSPSWMNYNLAKKIIAEAPCATVFGQWIDAADRVPESGDQFVLGVVDGKCRHTHAQFLPFGIDTRTFSCTEAAPKCGTSGKTG